MQALEAFLAVEDLDVHYGGSRILRDISLNIQEIRNDNQNFILFSTLANSQKNLKKRTYLLAIAFKLSDHYITV